MSQHWYNTRLPDGTPVSVCAGWDRQLGRLFLGIEGPKEDARTDENGEFYPNSFDGDAPKRDWSHYARRLAEHGIEIPAGMTAGILEDMARDAGNETTDWTGAAGAREPTAAPPGTGE